MRLCRNCKNEFKPIKSTQVVCSYKCAMAQIKDKRLTKDKVQTAADVKKILQRNVNKLVRLIDTEQNCISCGGVCKKPQAGHFYSSGGNINLTFNLLNIWVQCYKCNMMLSGNVRSYQDSLINMYGLCFIDDLTALKQVQHKYTKHDLELMNKAVLKLIKEHELKKLNDVQRYLTRIAYNNGITACL